MAQFTPACLRLDLVIHALPVLYLMALLVFVILQLMESAWLKVHIRKPFSIHLLMVLLFLVSVQILRMVAFMSPESRRTVRTHNAKLK